MQGARVVQEKVLSKIDSKKLTVFVVWLPFVDGDSREKAAEAMKVLDDKRAKHFWDSRREIESRIVRKLEKAP